MKLLKRKIDKYLLDWKNNPKRKPLIVKGARQIGKTESIRAFGEASYSQKIDLIRRRYSRHWLTTSVHTSCFVAKLLPHCHTRFETPLYKAIVAVWQQRKVWQQKANQPFFRFKKYSVLLLVSRFFRPGMLESRRPKAATFVGFSRLTPTFSLR